MALLDSYHIPGAYVEDCSIDVPLDWRGLEPISLAAGDTIRRGAAPEAIPGAPESIKLFYRVVVKPENRNRDLPLLVYLQGGPGGEGPRLTSAGSDGWTEFALEHFRIVLPDQRGTGRSTWLSAGSIEPIAQAARAQGLDPARAQADYLKRFLAPSIVRDFEYLRLTQFGGRKWATLGQSYGGFLTLSYLSFYPEGVAASFTCGGIPHVPGSPREVYEYTFPRMVKKTRQYYERYPGDEARVAALADRLAKGDVTLPDGSPFTVRRLQFMGSDFGMKPCWERMHNLLDMAFADGDGSIPENHEDIAVTDGFKLAVLSRTSSYARPGYWTLQEPIFVNGTAGAPCGWAAAHEYESRPEFSPDARPLMFTGEAMFPWVFEEDPALKPFKPAMDVLMADTEFDPVYDPARLAANEVPLQAAVYFDDLYVPSDLQLDTLSRVGASHAWVTNEFEHDGNHGTEVFKHLYMEAYNRGDLDGLLG